MISKVVRSCILHQNRQAIRIISNNQIKAYFCKLPKPSRFSQQLGLHSKFQKTSEKAQKEQKSLSGVYQFIIWGSICLVGSILMSFIIKSEFQSKVNLIFCYVKLKILPYSSQHVERILEQTIKHQQQYYRNRLFKDAIVAHIIQLCLNQSREGEIKQQDEKNQRLITEALYRDLNNRLNQDNRYSLYNKLLQKLLLGEVKIKNNYNLDKIVSALIHKSELQTLYLLARLYEKKYINVNKEDRAKMKERMGKYKESISETEAKIKQIVEARPNLLVQPYLFECEMSRKWIGYIQKYF